LIDWIDTVVNIGVPVALICTDQFTKLKSQVERQTGWTSDQFIHRTGWKETIETRPAKDDLHRMTDSLLHYRWSEPNERWLFDADCAPDQVNVNTTAAYAANNLLPLPSIRSIIDEARVLARERGPNTVGALDIKRALQSQQRSDLTIRAAFSARINKSKQARNLLPPGRRPGSVEPGINCRTGTDVQFFAQRRRRTAADSYAFNSGQSHPPLALQVAIS
jgi:hypothetical protein